MKFRILLLALTPWTSVSEELTLVFRESHFMDQYRHETYINAGQYVYIDDHFKLDSDNKWIPSVPALKTKVLDAEAQRDLIKKLVNLGVNDWSSEYPEGDITLLCDGLSFTLFVKSNELNVYSSGGCRFPPNYEQVSETLEDL